MMTVQVGDGGGWCSVGLWRERKPLGGRSEEACFVAEDLLMETVSGKMVLVSNIKFVRRSSIMETELWPLRVGGGMWDMTFGGRSTWDVRKWRQSVWTSES